MAAGSSDCLTNKGDPSTANVRPEMKPGCCRCPVSVSGPVYLLVMLFSMSTWITIVGIWIEMPLMVNELPEGWSLPAYLSIVIQCSNLGPAVYGIVLKVRRPKNDTKRMTRQTCIDFDVILTFLLIGCAIISMFLLSFLWSVTSQVGGQKHSVVLFVLVSVASLVSCTSSVVFLPFMAKFAPPYITAYYIGQGMCGLIPGLLGLVQGIGQGAHMRQHYASRDRVAQRKFVQFNCQRRCSRIQIAAILGQRLFRVSDVTLATLVGLFLLPQLYGTLQEGSVIQWRHIEAQHFVGSHAGRRKPLQGSGSVRR